jgi:SAM-dependent methyltransferase
MVEAEVPYDTLAGVYEWLVPEALLTPSGAVDAFAGVVEGLRAGGRVLDCAAGTGQLAVGLALRGYDVAASDASPAMVERTGRLAAEHGVELRGLTCRWEDLDPEGFGGLFDAVFCVGNSLTHAGPSPARRAALKKMAAMLRDGGLLVLTSRNWELIRRRMDGLEIAEELVERRGRKGLVVHYWTLPDLWDDEHFLDVAVALLEPGGKVVTSAERLTFWPFTHRELDDDLRASGLTPETSTYADNVERYLLTGRRSG